MMNLTYGTFPAFNTHSLLRTIRRLDFLNLDTGPWVAGGAARRALTADLPVGDVDVFFPSEEALTKALARMKSLGANHTMTSGRSEATYDFTMPDGTKVQLVRHRFFDGVPAMFSDFDFGVCMVATDGLRWVISDRFATDAEERRLTVENHEYRPMFLARFAKYTAMGHDPAPGVLTHMLHLKDEKWFETRVSSHLRIELYAGDYA